MKQKNIIFFSILILLILTSCKQGFVKKVNIAKNIKELNEIIKEMDKLYFTGLSSFLGKEYNFTERVKMPPKDPFNSILSFGYTLLLYEIHRLF